MLIHNNILLSQVDEYIGNDILIGTSIIPEFFTEVIVTFSSIPKFVATYDRNAKEIELVDNIQSATVVLTGEISFIRTDRTNITSIKGNGIELLENQISKDIIFLSGTGRYGDLLYNDDNSVRLSNYNLQLENNKSYLVELDGVMSLDSYSVSGNNLFYFRKSDNIIYLADHTGSSVVLSGNAKYIQEIDKYDKFSYRDIISKVIGVTVIKDVEKYILDDGYISVYSLEAI